MHVFSKTQRLKMYFLKTLRPNTHIVHNSETKNVIFPKKSKQSTLKHNVYKHNFQKDQNPNVQKPNLDTKLKVTMTLDTF